LCGVAAANAAAGYSVNQKQESLVTVGMSQTDVQQAIGRPSRKVQFGNEPGPTWTYDVAGVADQATLFDVDFGSDGKVASISERLDETGH
jgi:outer membrane protein assembly factor BamE (lipoprotein component of BamABCDE complex)